MNTLRSRYAQAHYEACWTIGLTVAYFLWWYLSAYGLAPARGDIQSLSLVFGMPLWFLMSCIVGPCVFIALCAAMVGFVFKDMPLDVDTSRERDANES